MDSRNYHIIRLLHNTLFRSGFWPKSFILHNEIVCYFVKIVLPLQKTFYFGMFIEQDTGITNSFNENTEYKEN